jgi:hypothetical protein
LPDLVHFACATSAEGACLMGTICFPSLCVAGANRLQFCK